SDKKIILRPDQENDVRLFKEKLLDSDKLRIGIIVKPTGTGKTIISLACIQEFFNKYNSLSILWMTERIDVLKSQFNNNDKLDLYMLQDKYHILKWYNNNMEIDRLNKLLGLNDKPIFLITNNASLMGNSHND